MQETKGTDPGLANMSNFISNFFGAAGAYYQDGVEGPQKRRIEEMRDLVKAISGDEKINAYADEALHLQGTPEQIKSKYKEIRQAADDHLVRAYQEPFKKTPSKVDKVLNGAILFWELTLAQGIKQNIQEEKTKSKSPEAKSFLTSANNKITTLINTISTSVSFLRASETAKVVSEIQADAERSSVSDSFKSTLRGFKEEAK